MKYIIKSTGYNVLGDELQQELGQYEAKIDWIQPYLNRDWDTLEFFSEYEALCQLRKMYPDRVLTVLEDTGKVISTYGIESGMTSMIIKQVKDN